MLGTHTSGKKTLGEALVRVRNTTNTELTDKWRFDGELGELLRDRSSLFAESHRIGNLNQSKGFEGSWDDYIYEQELLRDENLNYGEVYHDIDSDGSGDSASNCLLCRVVETWHIGNLAWALQREIPGSMLTAEDNEETRQYLIEKTRHAIQVEQSKGRQVIAIYLDVSAESMIRRRSNKHYETSILPFEDEVASANHLYKTIGQRVKSLLQNKNELGDLNIPLLCIENNNDGVEAINNTLSKVLKFLGYFV